jgi:hypothetical protein
MQMDKSATILEAQWLEKEIPRIDHEIKELVKTEQELLTSPLETVSQAYATTYRNERQRAHPFYHRRRSVTPTRYGYRERMHDIGWFAILARILILAAVAGAAYIVYHNHQNGTIQKGVIWGSIVLIVAIGLAFAPPLADQLWDIRARKKAEAAAQEARQSQTFIQEKRQRQAQLQECRTRMAELQERLRFARARLDGLRRDLTSSNHHGSDSL